MAESGGEFVNPPTQKLEISPKVESTPRQNHTPVDVEAQKLDRVRKKLNNFIEKDYPRAQKLVDKKGKLIQNPMARINLGLTAVDKDGKVIKLNQDWQPTPESGLPQTPEPVPSEKLLQEMKSTEKVVDPETKQKFNIIKANWEKLSKEGQERVLVFLPPFNNAIEKGATNYRIQELARQLEMPTLAIDQPSIGGSDKITDKQKEAMKTGVGYKSIAEAELRVMKELGIKEIDLVGQSMGAFTAAEIARVASEYGIKVKNLVLIESPGIEDVSLMELAKRFLAEKKYLALYQSAPYDPRMREASGFAKGSLEQSWDLISWGASIFKNSGISYAEMMRKKVVPEYLKESLGANPELELTVINGTLSTVSPAEANNQMVEELKTAGYSDRVHHMTLPGLGHTALENARFFGSTTKLALTGSNF